MERPRVFGRKVSFGNGLETEERKQRNGKLGLRVQIGRFAGSPLSSSHGLQLAFSFRRRGQLGYGIWLFPRL